MPIKFRCNYCRQFLGISRAQAGGIVDCPTCGRSIRVPQLDGTLQPLPEPELNLQDAHLARALDELARLANVEEPQPVSTSDAADVDEDAENEIPQLIPEPIPIEVPIPPTPIAVHPPMQPDEVEPPPPVEMSPQERSAASASRERSLLSELAALSLPDAISDPHAGSDERSPDRSERPAERSMSPRPAGSGSSRSRSRAALLVAIAFVAGMLFERFVKVLELSRSSGASVAVNAKMSDVQSAGPLTGRITFKSADGTSQPDRGARVIAFPLKREGEVKLSVVGFRPADGEADAKVAGATLQALGGALATADDAGQFRLDVPAGTYQLLVLSHFQSRDEKEPVDPALQKLLAAYFDKPDDLLGRVKTHFGPLRVKGTGDVWDHSF
jgi:hypothetical protein